MKITNKKDVAEVLLYDTIGGDFWGGGVSARAFAEELNAIKAPTINLRINSPGGNVFDGFAMYEALRRHPARVEVDVDGHAASAASVVAMAGDTIRMAENGYMMIHNPHAMAHGGAADLRAMADLLDKVRSSIVDSYARRAKVDRTQLETMMDSETWLSADEAIAAGLADRKTEYAQPVAAHWQAFARLGYRNVPPPPAADVEAHRALKARIEALFSA